jgi:hypothetical protein
MIGGRMRNNAQIPSSARFCERGGRLTATAVAVFAVALAWVDVARAQGAGEPRRGTTEFSAQSRLDTRRPPTRLRVQPMYPYRRFSTDYPVPYEYEYPGPNGVRQCKARLVQEARPSGLVVVPRMQCWWEVR